MAVKFFHVCFPLSLLLTYNISVINKAGTGATQVRAIGGSNVVTVGSQAQVKPIGAGVQMATVGGKQIIVTNKPGGGQQQLVTGGAAGQQIIRTAGGQQILVMSSAGGVKTVQHVTTSQAGAGQCFFSWQLHFLKCDDTHPCTVHS